MNILVLSNLYPPHYIGGFELITQDTVQGLLENGHAVVVLTSKFGSEHSEQKQNILRLLPDPLTNKYGLFDLLRSEVVTRSNIKRTISRYKPDLILVTGMVGLSSSLPKWVAQSNTPVVYAIFDEHLLHGRPLDRWHRYWNNYSPNALKSFLKRIGHFVLNASNLLNDYEPRNAMFWFGSKYLAESFEKQGYQPTYSMLQYPPIPHSLLDIKPLSRTGTASLNLLFASRICKEKGLHTIIQALALLKKEGFTPTLNIAARRTGDEYEQKIVDTIREYAMEDQVHFLGLVPRADMPKLYSQHHAIVFATQIEEPFGMVPVEAMAASTAVISTATGGAKEYLQHNRNALIFRPEDANELAEHIKLLASNEQKRQELLQGGRNTAEPFTCSQDFVKHIEKFLYDIVRD